MGTTPAASGLFRERLVPFLALIVATVLCTGAAMALVYSRGVAFMVSPLGLALQVPIVALMAALTWVILARLRRLPLDAIGMPRDGRVLVELALGTLLGAGATVLPVLALAAAGVMHPSAARPAPPASVLVTGLASFVVNAVLQQVPMQGFGQVLFGSRHGRTGAIAVTTVFFTLAHASPQASALYLLNVALFGLVTALLFYTARPAGPTYAGAVGFHGGCNYAFSVLLGVPVNGQANDAGFYRWPAHASVWSGGRAGLEHGVAWTLTLAALAAALLVSRALRARRAPD